MSDRSVTTVSTKGQVILPKSIRTQLQGGAGTRLLVESTEEGVVLKAAPVFAPTRYEDVRGMLHRPRQPAKTIEEMDAGFKAG